MWRENGGPDKVNYLEKARRNHKVRQTFNLVKEYKKLRKE